MSETTVHPMHRHDKKGRRGISLRSEIFLLENPIPEEIRDSDTLLDFFSTFQIVPYAELSDSLLTWYGVLRKLSKTWGSVVNKVNTYAFGSKMLLRHSVNPVYDMGETQSEVSPTEKKNFFTNFDKFIKRGKDGVGNWIDLHTVLGAEYRFNGNGWVELVITEINGEKRATLHFHPMTNVRYKLTKRGEPKIAMVSPRWEKAYLEKHKAREIYKFPFYTEEKQGVRRTMFHLKHGSNEWYGRPPGDETDLDKYLEAKNSIYLIIQSDNQHVGTVVIEGEDGDAEGEEFINDSAAREAGYNSFIHMMEQQGTVKGGGKASPYIIFARLKGAKQLFLSQIKGQTNENWFKVIGEGTMKAIMRSEGVTPMFMGEDVAKGFSATAFVDDFMLNVAPSIVKHRNTICNFTNMIFSEIWTALQMEEMIKYSVDFNYPNEYLETLKTVQENAANNNSSGGNPANPGG